MEDAKEVAKLSPNKGRKTSVVFVRNEDLIASACNDFPSGVLSLDERFERPACYLYIEHAERVAIAKAARYGIRLQACTAYLPWFPCVECARMLVEVGTIRMVCVEPDWNDAHYHFKDSLQILIEGGVHVEYYKEAHGSTV